MERLLEDSGNYLQAIAFPAISDAFKTLGIPVQFIAMELNMGETGIQAVAPPKVKTSSEVVETALRDAER